MSQQIQADDFLEEPWWWKAVPRQPEADANSLPLDTEILVVGSGVTGLCAALHLARAGREVLVLDANELGYGASSRNAGFVGRTLKHGYGALLERYGKAFAQQVWGELRAAYDLVFDLVDQEQIHCHLRRCGRFMTASSPAQYESMARELELRRTDLGEDFEMVPRAAMAAELGSGFYHGGALIPDLGSIHPGLYQRGLQERAAAAGATLVGSTEVVAIKASGEHFEVRTTHGVVTAQEVVVATNGYTDAALSWYDRRIVPFHGYMVATEPLDTAVLDELLPRDRTYHDYQHNLLYFRRAPDEPRILLGGLTGPAVSGLGRKAGRLRGRLLEVFPQLQRVRLSRVWTGRCAGTYDLWPHIGVHDGVHYAMGYCFAGLPMGTYLGQKVAAKLLRQPEAKTVFAERPFKSSMLHWARPLTLALFMQWYDYRDRRTVA